MNNYSAWKLFKSQWSWKRDLRTALVLHPLVVFLFTTSLVIVGDTSGIDNFLYLYFALFISALLVVEVVYFSLKLLVMTLFSLMMSRAAKEDDDFKQKYDEALTWRK